MKKLLLLALCLGALAGRARAQAAPPDLVVVRVFEESYRVRVWVDRGTEKMETIEFGSGKSDNGMRDAVRGYYNLLSGLQREGYVLQGTVTPSGTPFGAIQGTNAGGFATLLFVKKP